MDKDGFRKYLTDRDQPVPEDEIIENIKMVERFEEFLNQSGKTLESAADEEFTRFSKILIEEGANTYLNFAALSRYAFFIENMELFLPVLAIFDGGEVMNVLHERLARATMRGLEALVGQLHARKLLLQTLNPLAALDRGYALVRRLEDEQLVRSTGDVAAGDGLDIQVSDGSVRARVE